MGKTAAGAVWLNPDRLSPYEYWQFWRNTNDVDVVRFLKLFTELPLPDIDEMSAWTGSEINRAKIVLADRATELLHGPDVLPGIHETVDRMFSAAAAAAGGSGSSSSSSSTEGLARVKVAEDRLRAAGDGIRIADLFVELGLAASKKEARRLIAGGGARKAATVAVDGSEDGGSSSSSLEEKVDDELSVLTIEDFASATEVVLRAGKKRAGVVELVRDGKTDRNRRGNST
jgi:tyrosyl-tRNA synthetase